MSSLIEKIWNNKAFKQLLILVLSLITIFYTLPWTWTNSLQRRYSGVDFQDYWYAGHYVRQGMNSYHVLFNDPNPNYWDPKVPGSGDPNVKPSPEYLLKFPIYYLDGHVATGYPVAQMLIVSPSTTVPLNITLELFSWFSWPVARSLWMVLNLTFAAVIPWFAIRLVDGYTSISFKDKLIFSLIFYNIYGLRQSIVIGQQTLICLLLLILALLYKENWILSGLLLGFGISKYSIGLPIFVYLLLQKKYMASLVSLLIQILGILFLIPLKWGSPMQTLMAYYRILLVNYSQNGVHLLARFQESQTKIVGFLVIIIITLFFLVRPCLYHKSKTDFPGIRIHDLSLLTIAVFLTTYHRIHDMSFMIFFLLSIVAVLINVKKFNFTQYQKTALYFGIGLIVALSIVPTWAALALTQVKHLMNVPGLWDSVDGISTISLLLMFGFTIWFQVHVPSTAKILQESGSV